jgi:choline/glycine/proline betaine transport protein
VATFFVTSSDSGSLVVDMITGGGHPDPPIWQRVFWAVAEGLVAATLLLVGGLKALQAASISVALPFSIVLLMIPLSLLKALRQEKNGASAAAD